MDADQPEPDVEELQRRIDRLESDRRADVEAVQRAQRSLAETQFELLEVTKKLKAAEARVRELEAGGPSPGERDRGLGVATTPPTAAAPAAATAPADESSPAWATTGATSALLSQIARLRRDIASYSAVGTGAAGAEASPPAGRASVPAPIEATDGPEEVAPTEVHGEPSPSPGDHPAASDAPSERPAPSDAPGDHPAPSDAPGDRPAPSDAPRDAEAETDEQHDDATSLRERLARAAAARHRLSDVR